MLSAVNRLPVGSGPRDGNFRFALALALCALLVSTALLGALETHHHGPFETDSDCLACNLAYAPADAPSLAPAVPVAILADTGTALTPGSILLPAPVVLPVPPLRGPPLS